VSSFETSSRSNAGRGFRPVIRQAAPRPEIAGDVRFALKLPDASTRPAAMPFRPGRSDDRYFAAFALASASAMR
jgi:hypothetical protein